MRLTKIEKELIEAIRLHKRLKGSTIEIEFEFYIQEILQKALEN